VNVVTAVVFSGVETAAVSPPPFEVIVGASLVGKLPLITLKEEAAASAAELVGTK
jgi:hypothetical protein